MKLLHWESTVFESSLGRCEETTSDKPNSVLPARSVQRWHARSIHHRRARLLDVVLRFFEYEDNRERAARLLTAMFAETLQELEDQAADECRDVLQHFRGKQAEVEDDDIGIDIGIVIVIVILLPVTLAVVKRQAPLRYNRFV